MPTQNDLTIAVAKINMELWNVDSDNENETDFSHGFVIESDISDTNSKISFL